MTKKIISITHAVLDRSAPKAFGTANLANQKRASNATTLSLSMPLRPRTGALRAALLCALLLCSSAAIAAIPPAEKLLPPDTLAVVSAPDWSNLREVYKKSPQSQFWDDAALKPFRTKFAAKWSEEFVKPLERDLGVKFDDYEALLQGQVTFAVTQEGWQGKAKDDGVPAFVFLLDAKDKSDLLKKNLAELRKKWSADGKAIKTEKIRDVEFSIVPLTTNDMPKTLRQFFPQHQDVEELGKEGDKKEAARDELVIGQYDSLLIVGSTVKVVEKIMARAVAGSSAATLAEQPDFESARIGMFRDAPVFGWLNAKTFVDVLAKVMADTENPDAPSPLPIPSASKIIAAAGLNGLKAVAFNFRDTGDGRAVELFLNAPESTRAGLMKLLAMETKESSVPAFVPADAVKFSRWRLDGQKMIATLEKMVADVFPGGLDSWNYILKTGSEAMQSEEPDYDIRKNIFGNLGDDLIYYEKVPRGKTAVEVASAPSLFLLGSPNAEKLAASLKGLLVILSPSGANPKTRDFLGRKIYSFKPPVMSASAGGGASKSLSYVASGGYVAFSADDSTLEEFLRSSESQGKALRDTAGLSDAVAKVGGQSSGWFTYENESERMRLTFDMLKLSAANTNSASGGVIESMIPFAAPEKQLKDWLDFALLPDYAKVSKYFGFSVWSVNASVNGITFKYYSPTPAQLKK